MIGAWHKGVDGLFADKRLAATYLAMAIILPFLLFSIHDGSNFRTFLALLTDWRVASASSETPWTILSLFLFSAIALGSVAMACWNAILTPSRDGVIGEVMFGFVAGLICTFVAALIYIAINLPAMIGQVVLAMAVSDMPASPAQFAVNRAVAVGIAMITLGFFLWVNARLCMTGPVMAAAGSLNPFPALARSWRLTAPAQWRILFFLLLFQIISFAILFAFVVGATMLMRGTADFGWQDRAISIGWIAVELTVMTLFLIVSTGLYRALVGETDISVFE